MSEELRKIRHIVTAVDYVTGYLQTQPLCDARLCQGLSDLRDELVMRAGELALGVNIVTVVPALLPTPSLERATAEQIATVMQKLDGQEDDGKDEDEEDGEQDGTKPAPSGRDAPAVRVRRPDGIPETYDMVKEAIESFGEDGATIEQIVGFVDVKWWPGVVEDQIDPSNMRGRFIHHPGGKWFAIEQKKAPTRAEEDSPPAKPVSSALRSWPKGPAPFAHNGNTTQLQPFEYRVAYHLHANMGKGHIPANLLIGAIFKPGETGRPADPAGWMRVCMPSMNPRLRKIGLEIDRYPPDGFFMREVPAK